MAIGELTLKSVPSRTTLRGQVAEALRSALITGEMKPGMVYPAPVIAAQLGVSATPVREAMLDLVREGMVEVVRNTGFRVTELTNAELDNLAELRLLIEVPIMGAVAEACEGQMALDVAELRPLARQLVEAAEEVDLGTYVQLDTEFHTRFLALHGNSKIVDEVRRLRSYSRLYGLESLAATSNLVTTTAEHEQMIDLALARDRAGMETLVRTHIGHVRREWAMHGSS
ncbi:GntR family transcriptional regulator [Nocardia australiensis]|uniref:GntR family transcriptional regulator n=1 Tax=Nocardia australiensis TaxID=2887191 RepID=UPI001D14C670|nr:GntR family transcriptional regulator [Nocardia australiensis]